MAAILPFFARHWKWLIIAALAAALWASQSRGDRWKAKADDLAAWQVQAQDAVSAAAGITERLSPAAALRQIALTGTALEQCNGALQVQNRSIIESAAHSARMVEAAQASADALNKAMAGRRADADALDRAARAFKAVPGAACETPREVMELAK